MTRQEALNLVTIPSSTNRADRFISVINAIYDEVEQLEAELAKKEQIYNTVVTHDSLLIGILKAELATLKEGVVSEFETNQCNYCSKVDFLCSKGQVCSYCGKVIFDTRRTVKVIIQEVE